MLKKILCLLLFVPALSYAADCQRLTFSSNTEYPPYLWPTQTESAPLEGFLVSFMQRLSTVTGIAMQPVYVGPWVRTQSQAHKGQLDLIAVFHTDKRATWLDYLQPELIQTPSSIWINKHNPIVFQQFSDLNALSGLSVTGNSLGQAFDRYAAKHLSITEISSIGQALRMLEEQRADYLVYELEPGKSFVSKLKTNEVVPLAKAVSSEAIFLALSKQSECNTDALQKKLSLALEQAQQEGWAEEMLVDAQLKWQSLQQGGGAH